MSVDELQYASQSHLRTQGAFYFAVTHVSSFSGGRRIMRSGPVCVTTFMIGQQSFVCVRGTLRRGLLGSSWQTFWQEEWL